MEVLAASFNSDASRLAIGFRAGFAIFQLHPFSLLFRSDYGGCNVVEPLDNTSLVVVAGSDDSPTNPSRRIQGWHIGAQHQRVITQTMFHTPVLNIKMNSSILAIVRETMIHVYNPQKGLDKEIATIATESNPRGAFAITATADNSNPLIAFPPKAGKGTVEIFDVHTLTSRRILQDLHKGAIRLIQFSPDGSLIATASESGTWVRVSAVDPADARYWQFRRGWTQASIESLSFSADQSMICCSSDHGTLHVWYLRSTDASASLTVSAAAQASSSMMSLLPVEDKLRAATFTLEGGRKCYAAFSEDNSRIYCVTEGGKLDIVQVHAATKSGKLEKTRDLLSYDPKKDGRHSSDDSEDDTVADN